MQYSDEPHGGVLLVHVYGGGGKNSTFELVEDDGHSMDYAKGEGVRRTTFTWNDASGKLSWTVKGGDDAQLEEKDTAHHAAEHTRANSIFFSTFKAILFPAADKTIPITAIGKGGSTTFGGGNGDNRVRDRVHALRQQQQQQQQHTCGVPQPGKGVFGADVGAQSNVHSAQACCDACAASKAPAPCVASVYDATGSVCFFKDASWSKHVCNASSTSYVIAQNAPPTPPPAPSPVSLSSVAIARPCGADGGPTMQWDVSVLVPGASGVPLKMLDSLIDLCLDCGSPCGECKALGVYTRMGSTSTCFVRCTNVLHAGFHVGFLCVLYSVV